MMGHYLSETLATEVVGLICCIFYTRDLYTLPILFSFVPPAALTAPEIAPAVAPFADETTTTVEFIERSSA